MAGEKSKILIIGGTGYIGKFIVEAAARSDHPTFALVRNLTPSDAAKSAILEGFKQSGVTLIQGDLQDHESLVKAFKQVDVVIATVGYLQLADQTKIIAAIKEAGNIKRFLPSEFGHDVDRLEAVGPAKMMYGMKSRIRRAVEESGIPYTNIISNFFAGYFLKNLGQVEVKTLPKESVTILGDGNTKGSPLKLAETRKLVKSNAVSSRVGIDTENQEYTFYVLLGRLIEFLLCLTAIFVKEEDIGTYTIKALDDPRTLNKNVFINPPTNFYNHNELVSLWEEKTGETLQRIYVPEPEVLKRIREAPIPINVITSIIHSVFVGGDQTKLDPSVGLEATELYPDVKYTTVDEYLNRLVATL